jgi:tetratricopeptide (TPR) repeat protein
MGDSYMDRLENENVVSQATSDGRVVNRRAVRVLLACGAVLAVAVHLVHGFQVKRNARGLFLGQADRAEREGRLAQAADYLARYLSLEPGATDARARYGLLLDRLARTTPQRVRAFLVLEQALRQDGGRRDVRLQVARLAIRLGRFADAREHLAALRRDQPEEVEVLHLLGRCEAAARQFDEAAKWYDQAARLAPRDPELCLEFATLLRDRLRKPDQADRAVAALLRADARALPAQRAAARYYRLAGSWDKAEDAARMLEELGGRDVELFLLAAEAAQARGRSEAARGHLERGLKHHPGDARLALGLARLDLQAGQEGRARERLRPALRALPREIEDLWGLANLLVDLGERNEAEELAGRLPESGWAWATGYLRGRLLIQEGAWGEARDRLESVRSAGLPSPELARQVDLLLADCHHRLGNPDQEVAAYRRALEPDPAWVPARWLLGLTLAELGRRDQAADEFRKLAPRAPEFQVELARVLLARNLRLRERERSWVEIERALKSIPEKERGSHEVQLLQAEVFAAQGQPEEARKLAEAERDRDPGQAGPWLVLAHLAEEAEEKGGPGAVLTLLDEAEGRLGRQVEWELARARHWARPRARAEGAEARGQLSKLEERLGRVPDEEHDRLLAGLAEASDALGDRAGAERLWRQLASRQAGNLDVRFVLLKQALRSGAREEARRLLAEVRRLEGEGGPVGAYGEAALKAASGRPGSRGEQEARQLLAEATSARASWARVPLREARLYELENRRARVLQLLRGPRRQAEASAPLRKPSEEALGPDDLSRVAAEVSLAGQGIGEGGGLYAPFGVRSHGLNRLLVLLLLIVIIAVVLWFLGDLPSWLLSVLVTMAVVLWLLVSLL